jgi:hypothetical protein
LLYSESLALFVENLKYHFELHKHEQMANFRHRHLLLIHHRRHLYLVRYRHPLCPYQVMNLRLLMALMDLVCQQIQVQNFPQVR